MGRPSLAKQAFYALALVAVSGCQTIPTTVPQAIHQFIPSMAKEPVGPTEDFRRPTVGLQWTTRTTGADGEVVDETHQILADRQPYRGRPAYRIETNGDVVHILDGASGSWMATTQNGKLLESAEPHNDHYRWPLWAGKTWWASFVYDDHVREEFWNVKTLWKVEGYETVTVPAGTFEAIVLQSHPDENNAVEQRAWFAPELGITVRYEFQRTEYHYLGFARYVTEMLSYRHPELSAAAR